MVDIDKHYRVELLDTNPDDMFSDLLVIKVDRKNGDIIQRMRLSQDMCIDLLYALAEEFDATIDRS